MESCQEDLRKRCNTAFREIKRPLHLRSMTQAVVRKNSVRESKSLKNRAFERIQSQGE
jgi:hypothetical protein